MEHKILLGWTAKNETFSGFWPQIHSRIHEKVLLWQPVQGIEALTLAIKLENLPNITQNI